VRTLSYGQRNKEQVDSVIDQIAAVCNLREKSSSLFQQSNVALLSPSKYLDFRFILVLFFCISYFVEAKNTLVQNALWYLERYFLLITFAAYMFEIGAKQKPVIDADLFSQNEKTLNNAPTENSDSYSKWFETRGELGITFAILFVSQPHP
jgi:hypothetical protein